MKNSNQLKGEMQLLNVLHLTTTDQNSILEELEQKKKTSPQFFQNSAIGVDCQVIAEEAQTLNFCDLFSVIKQLGFIPIGIRHLPAELHAQAVEAGWAILRPSKGSSDAQQSDKNSVQHTRLEVIKHPLRSGQQIYNPSGDVVVLQQTSAGSEVLAGGSVHVYGPLRGRVLAGVNGNQSARIFCQSLEAELVAIAGCYQLLDEMKTDLKGSPAMIYLEDGKLIVEAIA